MEGGRDVAEACSRFPFQEDIYSVFGSFLPLPSLPKNQTGIGYSMVLSEPLEHKYCGMLCPINPQLPDYPLN